MSAITDVVYEGRMRVLSCPRRRFVICACMVVRLVKVNSVTVVKCCRYNAQRYLHHMCRQFCGQPFLVGGGMVGVGKSQLNLFPF